MNKHHSIDLDIIKQILSKQIADQDILFDQKLADGDLDVDYIKRISITRTVIKGLLNTLINLAEKEDEYGN